MVIFWQFSINLGQVIWCWYSLPHLDHLPKHFRPILGHFLDNFAPFLSIFIILGQFGLCIKTLFKLYLCIWVTFCWYLCVIWVVFVYGWYSFAQFGYNVVHLFPCYIHNIYFNTQFDSRKNEYIASVRNTVISVTKKLY